MQQKSNIDFSIYFLGPVQFPVLGILPSILLRLGSGIFKKSSFELLGDVKRTWGSPIALRLGNIKAGE